MAPWPSRAITSYAPSRSPVLSGIVGDNCAADCADPYKRFLPGTHQRAARIFWACPSVNVSAPLAASRICVSSHSPRISPVARMRICRQQQVTHFVRDDVPQHRAEVNAVDPCKVLDLPEEHLRDRTTRRS